MIRKRAWGSHYEYNGTCLVGRLLSIINDLRSNVTYNSINKNAKQKFTMYFCVNAKYILPKLLKEKILKRATFEQIINYSGKSLVLSS